MSAHEMRAQIVRLVQQRPFQPFVINLENGDRAAVEHPETVAYDPTGASMQFTVLTNGLAIFSDFRSVTSIAIRDTGDVVGS